MSQYYVRPSEIKNGEFVLSLDESYHAICVARHAIGEEIKIFDGAGNRYIGEIKSVENQILKGRIKRSIETNYQSLKITLAFAVISRSAMENLLDYSTQAGASFFQPIICERTQRGFLSKWRKRKRRFEKIVLASAKQSERSFLPVIFDPVSFEESFCFEGNIYMAFKEGETTISKPVKEVIKIIIGPEGGFSAGEVDFARRKNAVFFSLGRNILKSEIAAPVALSLMHKCSVQ